MSFRRLLENLAGTVSQPGQSQAVKGVRKHAPIPTNVVRNGVRHVRPNVTPLIQQRGWKQTGNIWRGSYVTRFGTFDGQIERRGDIFDPMIKQPHEAVRKSPKWPCFHQRPGGWWSVHLHDNPCDGDPSAIIAYIERLMNEAFQIAAKK